MKALVGILSAVLVFCASASHAQDLASLSNQEASSGMKDAIRQGAEKAVDLLGRQDGFSATRK